MQFGATQPDLDRDGHLRRDVADWNIRTRTIYAYVGQPSKRPSCQRDHHYRVLPTARAAAKAEAYRGALHTHFFAGTLYGWLVLVLVLFWRLGPKYRDWAERASSRRFVQALIFAPLMLLTVSVLSLPTSIWDQMLELNFGRSVQHWAAWWSDWLTSQIVMLIVGTLVVWILYAVIRRNPRRWWFYFWLASVPLIALTFFLQPLIVDPLFFKFKPLAEDHPQLVEQVEQVVHHGGMDIPPDRIFEMNASTKTTELNAYVTGFGASKRAVLWTPS